MNTRPTALLASLFREVDRDAEEAEVPHVAARTLFWFPLIGAVVIAATVASRPLFLALVKEDGPIEWLQFVGFFAAAILLAVASVRLLRHGDVVGAVLLGIGALGVLGIAGEEISWGQRIFGLETPESLAEVNHQGEINVHNITSFPVQKIGNYLQLVLGGGGMLLPWLTRVRRPLLRHRLWRLLSPPLFVTTGFGLLFAYRLVRFAWDSEAMTVVKYGEWPELTFAVGLSVYAWVLVRDARRAGAPAMSRERTRAVAQDPPHQDVV